KLAPAPLIETAEIARPGLFDLRLAPANWLAEPRSIATLGADYGRSRLGGGRTVNVEYAAANPAGPMHMGHCRGAVVGDALAALLEFAGHQVIREYYVNDAGGQVDVLAESAYLRYAEALGTDIGEIPPGLYPGDYLVPIGQALAAEYGDKYLGASADEWRPLFRKRTVAPMLEPIKTELDLLGIRHAVSSSEAE